MNILVVGGAGYIGSHMVRCLIDQSANPVVLDNLSTGERRLLIHRVPFYLGDLSNEPLIKQIFVQEKIDAVMHFAAYSQVAESVQNPQRYYNNNIAATLNLLASMIENKIKYFIFSSTAAIYGKPKYTPIDENHPHNPINPYGRSKYFVEKILEDYAATYDFHYCSLRYFNAAGAHPSGTLGECHQPETHLIPIVLDVAVGNRDKVLIYGTDYNTHDGTCIRDYVHVSDLAHAHCLALNKLLQTHVSNCYNLGNEKGFSVLEIIEAAKQVTGRKISMMLSERRNGDPAILIAKSQKALSDLKWKPQYTDIKTIISHAWQWHLNNSRGQIPIATDIKSNISG